jgi:hypothetical protein
MIPTILSDDGYAMQILGDRTLEDQPEELSSTIEKMQNIPFSRIVAPMAKHWLRDFKRQSPPQKIVKISVISVYAGLAGTGFLAITSSIILLRDADFSLALSSDIDTRVNFANNITNAGALFACITDFPFLCVVLYFYMLQKAHNEAVSEVMSENYHSSIDGLNLTPENHEELYQRHISKLQSLGIDRFYLNPDLLSKTGAMYKELAPILEKIDREIEEGLSAGELGIECAKAFAQESPATKLAELGAGAISLSFMALSAFIILENAILIKDTPDRDLFSSNAVAQDIEAFYLTQLGGFFASLTAFGAAAYLAYYVFVQASYKRAMCKKINASFTAHRTPDLSPALSDALYRIKEKKLLKVS